jgi:hypothetical protein
VRQAGSTAATRASRGRTALGLFAAVWLNLVLQPCAMAFDTPQGRVCPHCPPAHEQAMPAHHSHDTAGVHCASLHSGCGDPGSISVDNRGDLPKIKLPGELPVLIVADVPEPRLEAARYLPPPVNPRDGPIAAPPLNVLFCVYLK